MRIYPRILNCYLKEDCRVRCVFAFARYNPTTKISTGMWTNSDKILLFLERVQRLKQSQTTGGTLSKQQLFNKRTACKQKGPGCDLDLVQLQYLKRIRTYPHTKHEQ
eukprot:778738-Pelagomonas_calceolata.AAC.6